MYRQLLTFVLLLFLGSWVSAQATRSAGGSVHHVNIGVNGLHCSACTYSVEQAIRKLDFVRLVKMDLNQREGSIYFQEAAKIDYAALAKAVFDAGFSVRSFIIVFDGPIAGDERCVEDQFCIVKKEAETGDRIQIVGKEYLEKKAWREMQSTLATACNCTTGNALRAVLL